MSRRLTDKRPERGEAGPPPLVPPAGLPQQAAAPGPSPHHQKLALYAGAALVVLIVLAILLLASGRQPLELVPRGQSLVQVLDVRRFFDGPVYAALAAADHPILDALESKEERYRISLRRDAAVLITTDDSTIVLGRFQPELLRDGFEETVELREKELNRGRQTPVQLQIKQSEVEGHTYWYCDQEGVDCAFAAVGSSLACFGDRWGVRRFLKGRAGVRGNALDDRAFAQAYSPTIARGAFLYRLEKPGGKLLTARLQGVLEGAGEGVRAALFALGASRRHVALVVRFAMRDPAAAQALAARLAKASVQPELRTLLGADATIRITRSEATVTFDSLAPLDSFEEMVEKDKRGQGASLILALLAG